MSPDPSPPRGHCPTASFTHFVVKLVCAAPWSFLSAAWVVQAAVASFWHLVRKLVGAAPASFFASALATQVSAEAAAAESDSRANAIASVFMIPCRRW